MYDEINNIGTSFEEYDNATIINLEELGEDQTIGDDNFEPAIEDEVIFDNEDSSEEDIIEEPEELSVFEEQEDDSEEEDEFDDTGFSDDDYEDMNEDE